ncbi:MAG: rhomboid family intramembrane serine protease [Herbinix sp.]|nr:rhomboid family intramembrane serine protease [Herbinix sp.]
MKNTKDRQHNLITIILITINIIAYIITSTNGDMKDTEYLVSCGGNYWTLTFSGEWTRLIYSMFIHSGLIHLLSNMIVLYFIGTILETTVGKFKYLIIYFSSGIIGGALGAYLNMIFDRHIVSVGASGAIYGIMAAAFLLEYKTGKEKLSTVIIAPIVYAIFTFAIGVDLLGHIFGSIIGSIIGLFLIRKKDLFELDGEIMPVKDKSIAHKIKNILFSIAVIIVMIILVKNFIEIGNNTKIDKIMTNKYVEQVYNGQPDGYNQTYGEAFNSFFSEPEWDHFTSDDNKEVVEFTGKCLYENQEVEAYLQFAIIDEKSFSLSYLAFEGNAQTYPTMEALINAAFQENELDSNEDAGTTGAQTQNAEPSAIPTQAVEVSITPTEEVKSSSIDWEGTYSNETGEIKIKQLKDNKLEFTINVVYGQNCGNIKGGIANIQENKSTAVFQGDNGFELYLSWKDSELNILEKNDNGNPYAGMDVTFDGTYSKY